MAIVVREKHLEKNFFQVKIKIRNFMICLEIWKIPEQFEKVRDLKMNDYDRLLKMYLFAVMGKG